MRVLVTGAGPAGCASAIALRRAGLEVELWTGPSRRPWLEGLSPRTAEALADAHCTEAAELASAPATRVERYVRWGALHGATNRESLLDRCVFDTALRRDAERSGIRVVDTRMRGAGPRAGVFESDDGHCQQPHFWVDARGRSARRQRGEIHGAPTLAIALACRVRAQVPLASALIAAERGFWWISVGGGQGNDRGWALWFRDPPPDSPDRGARSPEYGDEIAVLRAAEGPSWLASLEANPMARPLGGRDATPYLSGHLIDADRFPSLAVGDAAMAGDPLSGQGVFRALAMAAAASAALRTRLGRPGSKELAMRFYRERVQAMYSRESQKGLAFYRDEGRWPRAPFWTRRQQGPVDAAAARETAPRIERRPVAREGWVEEDRVLVTSAHPEGVWSYQGVPVAALLDARARSREELARRFSVEPGRIDEALAWLRHLGVEGGARVTGTHRPQTLAGIDGAASHPAE